MCSGHLVLVVVYFVKRAETSKEVHGVTKENVNYSWYFKTSWS